MASTAWQKRNAAARAKGYRNYYDYRAHDFGRMAPGTPAAKGERLRRLRGHAGPGDLRRALRSGRVELINAVQTGDDPPTFDVLVVYTDGTQRSFTVKGKDAIDDLAGQLQKAGPDGEPAKLRVIGTPNALKKLQQMQADAEAEEAQAEFEAEGGESGEEPYTFTDDDIPF